MRLSRTEQSARVNAVMSTEDRAALSVDERDAIEEANSNVNSIMSSGNTALQDAFISLRGLLQDAASDSITLYYRVGELFRDVKADRSGAVYGKGAFKQLCTGLQYPAGTACKAATFANEYTEEEVAAIVAMQNPTTGKRLSVEHLRHLLSDRFSDAIDPEVKLRENKAARRGYMTRCINAGWSSKTLSMVIQQEHGSLRTGGRTSHALTDKNAALEKLSDYYNTGNHNMSSLWLGDDNNIIALLTGNMNGVTEETLTVLDLAEQRMRDHLSFLNTLMVQWDTAHIRERITNYLGQLTSDEALNTDSSVAAASVNATPVSPVMLPAMDNEDDFLNQVMNDD